MHNDWWMRRKFCAGKSLNMVKQCIPPPIRRTLLRTKTYYQRLNLLRQMKSQISGKGTVNAEVVRRSFAAAPSLLLRELDLYRYPTLLDDATVYVKGFGIFAVRGGTDDLAHIMPSFQRTVLDMAKQYAKPGSTVIDAGANIGALTYAMSRYVGPNGKVLSVEMMPDTANILRQTIALNNLKNVTVFENALSDTDGLLVTARVEPGLHGQASIARDDDRTGLIDISVESTTLDKITDGQDEIAFIKMDLEGAEPLALAGGTETLRRTRAMMVEVWYPETDPAPRILKEAGFQISWHGLDVLAVRDF